MMPSTYSVAVRRIGGVAGIGQQVGSIALVGALDPGAGIETDDAQAQVRLAQRIQRGLTDAAAEG